MQETESLAKCGSYKNRTRKQNEYVSWMNLWIYIYGGVKKYVNECNEYDEGNEEVCLHRDMYVEI